MTDTNALAAEARLDAKAFRENTVYDSEGDPIRLIANADRLDAYADALERAEQALAERDAEIARLQRQLAEIAELTKRRQLPLTHQINDLAVAHLIHGGTDGNQTRRTDRPLGYRRGQALQGQPD